MSNIFKNFISALTTEIQEVKGKDIVIEFTPLKRLSQGQPQVYYCSSEEDLKLPDGAQVKLVDFDEKVYAAEVIASEDFGFVIATSLNLKLNQVYKLRYNMAWILEALLDWVKGTSHPVEDFPIAKGVLQSAREFNLVDYGTPFLHVDENLNSYQYDALHHALRYNLTFIWGPPGTGKSMTLSEIIVNYLFNDLSVLFVSQSNAAVDVVAKRVLDYDYPPAQKLREKGLLIRSGYPSLKPLKQWNDMLPEQIALRKHPELANSRRKLQAKKELLLKKLKQGEKVEEDIKSLTARLSSIGESIREEIGRIKSTAPFVATTVASLSLTKELCWRKFDAVVIDEASMLNIPSIFTALTLAKEYGVVAGDFLQLQPIHQSRKGAVPRWLGNSVFKSSGISESPDSKQSDPRLVTLREQYRMADEISALVNGLFYGGILENAPLEKRRIQKKDKVKFGERLVLADTSGLGKCLSDLNSKSRYNLESALKSLDLVRERISDNLTVGIITPYRAQAKVIRSLFDKEELDTLVSVSTIQKFQGFEKDVIILDLTDGFPQSRPGVLLSGSREGFYSKNSPTLPLLNVALSRAKSQVIVLADKDFFKSKLTNSSLVLTTLKHLEQMGLRWEVQGNTLHKPEKVSRPVVAPLEPKVEKKLDLVKVQSQLKCTRCGARTVIKRGYSYYSHCSRCRSNQSLTDDYLLSFLLYQQPKCPRCSEPVSGVVTKNWPKLSCVSCGYNLPNEEVYRILVTS